MKIINLELKLLKQDYQEKIQILFSKTKQNLNLKDNNYKSPIKIFEQENISTKRKSVSIPKKYYKNNFEGRINKKYLSKIFEEPILNTLLKEISDFHNLNKELFIDIENLVNNKEELYNKFYILI